MENKDSSKEMFKNSFKAVFTVYFWLSVFWAVLDILLIAVLPCVSWMIWVGLMVSISGAWACIKGLKILDDL